MKKEESILQQQMVTAFRLQYPKLTNRLFAIPNGGSRNIIEAVRLKREGVLAGVCDIFLTVPKKGFSGLFCEVKTKQGRLSQNQIEFIKEHENDYKCVIVRSVDAFLTEIKNYLS